MITDAVGILMGYVGVNVNMDYGLDASSAMTYNIAKAFQKLDITSNTNKSVTTTNKVLDWMGVTSILDDFDASTVRKSLNAKIPVIIRAQRTRKDHSVLGVHLYYTYKNGHAWIINGYESDNYVIKSTYIWVTADGGEGGFPKKNRELSPNKKGAFVGKIETDEYQNVNTKLIMNWGWSGSGDSGRYSETGAWDSQLGNYQYNREILHGFNF